MTRTFPTAIARHCWMRLSDAHFERQAGLRLQGLPREAAEGVSGPSSMLNVDFCNETRERCCAVSVTRCRGRRSTLAKYST